MLRVLIAAICDSRSSDEPLTDEAGVASSLRGKE